MPNPAPACKKALRDATARWPNRNRASDGIMGDAAHRARPSDHNLGNAFDLTHDPAHGVNCHVLSRQVATDRRVTYVIWNRQIYSRARASAGWREYNGSNPHNQHMHVSIADASRNDLAPWPWSGVIHAPVTDRPSYPGHTMGVGDTGEDVRRIQGRLRDLGWTIKVDGVFGPRTLRVVRAFQQQHRLTADGIVGPATWSALW